MWYEFSEKSILDHGNKYTITCIKNVTKYQNNISHLLTDPVTNIPTRCAVNDLLNVYLKHAYEENEKFAIIMADLDNFKAINDAYGHYIGDMLLSEVGFILKNGIRKNSFSRNSTADIVGRYGGDEFIILLKNISANDAYKRISIIKENISRLLLSVDEYPIKSSTMSFGITYVTEDDLKHLKLNGTSLEEFKTQVLQNCDDALYKSKDNGKNKITEYNFSDGNGNQKTFLPPKI